MRQQLSFGIDLSDTCVCLAAIDASGVVAARAEVAAAKGKAFRDAIKRTTAASGGLVGAIGVATAVAGESMPDTVKAALGDLHPDVPVAVIPAGTAAAVAEQWCGAARDSRHVVAFSIAEHVTAGIVLDGTAWRGSHGLASSVACMALNPVEREDYRRLGGLEAEVAAAGIVRRLVWRIKSGDRSRVADQVAGDFTKITANDIFDAARDGDGVSISVVRDTAKYIGMAVANLAAMFDPDVIVLGGIMAASGETMVDAIRTECARRLRARQFEQIRIVVSTLGADAVAIGAARAASLAGQ